MIVLMVTNADSPSGPLTERALVWIRQGSMGYQMLAEDPQLAQELKEVVAAGQVRVMSAQDEVLPDGVIGDGSEWVAVDAPGFRTALEGHLSHSLVEIIYRSD